jgi:SAM-dependent methyltransferase
VADEVEAFYERHPYPPPADDLESYRRRWRDPSRRRAEHHLFWPARAHAEPGAILIAGCGTSQAAKHAIRWPRARVTGVDISSTSVACTEELKRRYDLHNLEVRQLPIERVGELGVRFDQIVCTGVLHHLADPGAALGALRDVLAPGGAMHLMVYAPYGRTGIYMLQEFCRRLGIEATSEGIRDLATALEVLPREHPLAPLLRGAPDFQDGAGLADALLHPRDRAYSVPQLFDLIAGAGLTFGRWLQQAPYSASCGVMTRLPAGARARIATLPPSQQFAVAELFRGTMVRHSAIVYRDEATAAAQRMGFSGGDWPGYVPIPAPDAICVRERLPPGAAAVLLNRGHAYPDIILPIDAREARWFLAVDGERSIAEIAEVVETQGTLEAAGRFFEQLYQHDQVVFDAVRRAATPSGPTRS